MTEFAPHRATWESFIDCMHNGADKDVLARLFAENAVLNSPLGDEPLVGRESVVEANRLSTGWRTSPTRRSSAARPTTPHRMPRHRRSQTKEHHR
jgi:hypothetical protein